MKKLLGKALQKAIKMGRRPFCSAIVAAAGSSSRMNGENKIFSLLNGTPVLALSLRALEECPLIDEIVVVARSEDITAVAELCREYEISKVNQVVCGGDTRPESVQIGLQVISDKAALVAVHDGARPLVTEKIIRSAIRRAEKYLAVAPAVPVKDTIKRAVNQLVTETPDRSELYAIQTPQVFEVDLYKAALSNALEKGLEITDDCMAVEAIGGKIWLSEGSYENIKITTPADLAIAEAILRMREAEK